MNTPNKLTIARMIIVPFLVIFLLTGWGGEANRYISLTLFVVASVTDWFDGYLARKNNLVTNFGKFMDDLYDRSQTSFCMVRHHYHCPRIYYQWFPSYRCRKWYCNCCKLLGKI